MQGIGNEVKLGSWQNHIDFDIHDFTGYSIYPIWIVSLTSERKALQRDSLKRYFLIGLGDLMEVALSTLITMYIIMVGPVKLILPFAHVTARADASLKREIAIRTTLWGGSVALICLLVGDFVVGKLFLSVGTLKITLSIFLAAFAYSLAHVGDPSRIADSPPPETPTKELALFPLAFPGVIPPQGFALLVLSTQMEYPDARLEGLALLIVLTVIIMLINFIVMIGADTILKITGRVFWLLLCRFLSPLYVALAIHIFLLGLQERGILTPAN